MFALWVDYSLVADDVADGLFFLGFPFTVVALVIFVACVRAWRSPE